MKNKTRLIAINGIGIALFVALSLCVQVPVFQNYYLCLGYIIMAIYLYFFGMVQGGIVGVLGTILYCFLISGLRGMPGWALGNIFIAVFLGGAFKFGRKITNVVMRYIVYGLGILLGCSTGILLVKSFVEHVLYAQPMLIRMGSNLYAFVADYVVLVIGIPVCKLVEPWMQKCKK